MRGGHDSVTSVCLASHMYTFSCHKSDEMFSTGGGSLPLHGQYRMRIVIQRNVPFVNGRAKQVPLSEAGFIIQIDIQREHLHTPSWMQTGLAPICNHQLVRKRAAQWLGVYNRKSVQLPYGFYTRHLDRMP